MRSHALNLPVALWPARGRRSMQLVDYPRRPGIAQVVVLNGLRLARRLLFLGLRHPVLTSLALALALSVLRYGPGPSSAVVATAVIGGIAWWRVRPDSYYRLVGHRLRAAWRRAWVYARIWQPAMVSCGLGDTLGGSEWLPTIRRVRCSAYDDAVLVDLLAGQAPEDYERAADALAHTFAADSCRVRVDRPGRVWLRFARRDPLAQVVPALPVPASSTPAAVAVGLAESHGGGEPEPWTLPLLGSHVLIAGATGSGKGSVMWSLIRGLLPGVRDGSVRLWAVDPKGGMELTPGAPLFARFAYADPESMVELLEDAVDLMRERSERLRRSGARVHVPAPLDPLVVVLVDELAALVAYGPDRDHRRRAEHALSLLLSQGRAPGVLVVAAVQDPGKDVVAFRDLFPVRVALRLVEDVQVDMVLGRGARARGAACDRIPPSLPGVGYVVLDGVREPVRVRAALVADEDLREMTGQARHPDGLSIEPPADGAA